MRQKLQRWLLFLYFPAKKKTKTQSALNIYYLSLLKIAMKKRLKLIRKNFFFKFVKNSKNLYYFLLFFGISHSFSKEQKNLTNRNKKHPKISKLAKGTKFWKKDLNVVWTYKQCKKLDELKQNKTYYLKNYTFLKIKLAKRLTSPLKYFLKM